jgi:CBS domain-containing protein
MSRTTYCVRPGVSIRTAASMLLDERMSGAPVVDDDGRPVGIVSKTDLLRHLHERGDAVEAGDDAAIERGFHATHVDGTTVADVMMPVVFAIAEDTTIAAAAALMAGEGIHRVPVLDRNGAVVGILSTLDVVRWVAERAGYHV